MLVHRRLTLTGSVHIPDTQPALEADSDLAGGAMVLTSIQVN